MTTAPLAQQLFLAQGLRLIAKLRKRALIESINDQLKNVCQIEHTRHRSPLNFVVHLLAGLIAYCYKPKKPSLRLHHDLLPCQRRSVSRMHGS
jgi:hypothetical protein